MDTWTNPLFQSVYDHMEENMTFLCNNEGGTSFSFTTNYQRIRFMILLTLNRQKSSLRIEVRYPIKLSHKHYKSMVQKVSEYNCNHYLGFLTFDTSDGELASTWATPLEDATPMSEDALVHLFSVLLRGVCNMGHTAMEMEFGLPAEVRDEIKALTDGTQDI